MDFKEALDLELRRSEHNNFGSENYDVYRYGKISQTQSLTLVSSLKRALKKTLRYQSPAFKDRIRRSYESFRKYEPGLRFLYDKLNENDKELLVKIIAFRMLGYKKVKLPLNTKEYWTAIDRVKKLKVGNETYDPHFMHFVLDKFDLSEIGYDLRMFFGDAGVVTDFVVQQYAYKASGKTIVEAEKGDVVLDIGGCWGDTALYFASKVYNTGKVFSFEFIPENIRLFNINTALNPKLVSSIELVPHPVSNVTGETIYFKDNGPGSKIKSMPFEGQTGSSSTLTIDDFVQNNNLTKVDFIKMDIEGAEPMALEGAINTIKKYRPKLAISIYHSLDDFVNIPKWILDLNLGYELYIGHYTIHAEETVCFAKPKGR